MSNFNEYQAVELFSGSKNVSGVLSSVGFDVVSVDINSKLEPSICCDILQLRRDQLPRSVDFIWASPVCTQFSRAASPHHWRKVSLRYRQYLYEPLTSEAFNSLAMLEKTIEVINWFPNVSFVIENPVGRIQHTAAVKRLGHYRYFVNYFDFGFSYSKETYLFSNLWLPFSLKKYKVDAPGMSTIHGSYARSKVPALLVSKIISYGSDQICRWRNSIAQ